MNVENTTLAGCMILTPDRYGDDRGWFSEVFNARAAEMAGVSDTFVQDNHSFSATKGTLRGLHYQAPPHAQAKLVRCSAGAIYDVAVDVRRGSPTFGQWFGIELSARNGCQLLVPEGFLHGFCTLCANVEVQYKCSDYYAPKADGGVRWNSRGLNISWPDSDGVTLSDKDRAAPDFADWNSPFEWRAQ